MKGPVCEKITVIPTADELATAETPESSPPGLRSASRSILSKGRAGSPPLSEQGRPFQPPDSGQHQLTKSPRRIREVTDDERQPAQRSGWFGHTGSGLAGGVAMILIAVVWFAVGLAAGIIFHYPPILFIIGVVAVNRGMMNRQ